ncbi:MAG: pantetheine-phosphate adenylyltransferase [Puniceicoccales bacterium]|jgi:pantetheine-phosphate adenylyltransferase|nr:pantetheine-phosphate adenylyltransferase [Puniceicoccales bacterium]
MSRKTDSSTPARKPRIAVYPGTFDPLTSGHLDVLRRASLLFDHVIMAIAVNEIKRPLFTIEERVAMAREALKDVPNTSVEPLHGLTVMFAKERGAVTLIRGLRKFTDFEYEFDLAHTNRMLAPDIETIVLMPSKEQFCTSSTFVKEIAQHKIDEVAQFVPPGVLRCLQAKFAPKKTRAKKTQ